MKFNPYKSVYGKVDSLLTMKQNNFEILIVVFLNTYRGK